MVLDESGIGMKVVLDQSGIGMKVVLDQSGLWMKVVLDEFFCTFIPIWMKLYLTFFSRRVKFDSGFNVMAVYVVS